MCGGRFYTSSGQVYDSATNKIVADLLDPALAGLYGDNGNQGMAVTCNATLDRLYVVGNDLTRTKAKIDAYRLSTLTRLGSLTLADPSGISTVTATEPAVAMLTFDGRVLLAPLGVLQ
jgi:hypothetical protein